MSTGAIDRKDQDAEQAEADKVTARLQGSSYDDSRVYDDKPLSGSDEEETAGQGKTGSNSDAGQHAVGDSAAAGINNFNYRSGGDQSGGKTKGLKGKAKSFLKSTGGKVTAIVGGVGLVGILAGILAMAGSLLIPNFATSVIGYQFLRTTRQTLNTNHMVTSQKTALDSASDNAYRQAMERFKAAKNNVWEKINNYRPKKIFDNMVTTGKLDFQYSEPKGAFGRRVLERVIVDGVAIDIPENSVTTVEQITSPIETLKQKIQTRRDIKIALNEAMRGRNLYFRFKVMQQIRAKLNVKLWAWSAEDLKKMRGMSTEQADLENTRQSHKVATNGGSSTSKAKTGSKSDDIKNATDTADEEMAKCIGDDRCLKATIDNARAGNGDTPKPVIDALGRAFDSSVFKRFLNIASPAYAIAAPLCFMYEGSIVNSEGVINANSEQAMRLFYRVGSADSQQKFGGTDVNGEAIGALTRQLGETGRSNAQIRANGFSVDTVGNTASAQASAGGTYTADIFDTFLPSDAAAVIRSVAGPLCGVMTNPWTNVALIAANLIPGVGQAMQAGGQITVRGIAAVIGRQLAQVTQQFFSKKGLTQTVSVEAGILLGTLLAKSLVLNHLASSTNGLAQGTDFDNVVDMGGNLAAQESDRVQNYAIPSTNATINQLRPLDAEFRSQELQQQSIYQRYFAVTNPGSMANELVVNLYEKANASGVKGMLSSTANLLNPFRLLSMATSPLHKMATVKAQSSSSVNNEDYGIVQFAWSEEEENAFLNDPKYSLLVNQEALDASGKAEEIHEKYGKCFSPDVPMSILLAGQEGGSPSIYRQENGDIITDKGDCSPQELGMRNPTYGDLVYRYRVAGRYNNAFTNLLDAQELQ